MARVPPGGDAEPEPVEFGIPVLDDRLAEADLAFPAGRDDVEAAMGDVEVPYDAHGHTVTVAEALAEVDRERFDSGHDLLEALHPVLEARRQRTGVGWLSTIRSMLPF